MSVTELGRRVGRRTRRALFLPRYHPHFGLGRSHGGYITCAGKHDRAGSQALAVLSTMVFADRAGLRYVHTQFREMDGTTPEEVNQWEAFFNLGHEELRVGETGSLGLASRPLQSPADLPFSETNTLWVVRHCHDYANRFPNEYHRIASRVARKYAAVPKDRWRSHYDPTRLNVAVHVRRGDVTRDGPYADRYTTDGYLRSVLNDVLAVAGAVGLPVAVRLYSDGRIDEFADLTVPGLHFHVAESPFATFNNLVEADVLVMSKSTFSYVAALLSGGVPIYESFSKTSFNHRPLGHWVTADEHGRVKTDTLRRALTRVATPHE